MAIFGESFNLPQKNNSRINTVHQDNRYLDPITFSAQDADVYAVLPFLSNTQDHPVKIPIYGLQLVNYSTHADTYPVTNNLERRFRGVTKGHVVTAGSFGFSVMGEDPWADVIRAFAQWRGYVEQNLPFTNIHQVPEFDIMCVWTAAGAESAILVFRSISITDTANNFNVKDIELTHNCAFIAKNVSQLTNTNRALKDDVLVFDEYFRTLTNRFKTSEFLVTQTVGFTISTTTIATTTTVAATTTVAGTTTIASTTEMTPP